MSDSDVTDEVIHDLTEEIVQQQERISTLERELEQAREFICMTTCPAFLGQSTHHCEGCQRITALIGEKK